MRKALGLKGLLVSLVVLACAWEYYAHQTIKFITPTNIGNVLTLVGLFGILSLAQSIVIITGGIDLSVGSVAALVGISAAMLMDRDWPPALALPTVLAGAAAIGAWHGLLVTKARIQPFIVTLCGLFLYRGAARLMAEDRTQGFGIKYEGLKWFGRGYIADLLPASWDSMVWKMMPAPFLVMLFIAIVLAAYLHFSAPGRHLFAIGANEEAARFSGIRTERTIIAAYIMCSLITGLGSLLIAFKVNSLGPSDFGSFYELYAIAGAVLGGCSLRGGAGNVLGIVIGAALIMILRNLVNILGIPSQLEYMVIGGAILLGVFADEMYSRRRAVRLAR